MILATVQGAPVALWCPFRPRPWFPALPAARLRQPGGYLYPVPPRWREALLRAVPGPRQPLPLDGAPGAVEIVSCFAGQSLRIGPPFARSALLRIEEGALTLDAPLHAVSYDALEIEIVQDFGI